MRLTLTDEEIAFIKKNVKNNLELVKKIDEQITKQGSFTEERRENIKIAIQAKADIAKKRVFEAIETLIKSGIKINSTEIMRIANVSKNTALKYKKVYDNIKK